MLVIPYVFMFVPSIQTGFEFLFSLSLSLQLLLVSKKADFFLLYLHLFIINVCNILHWSLRRADHSSRGVLTTVVCRWVLPRNRVNEEAKWIYTYIFIYIYIYIYIYTHIYILPYLKLSFSLFPLDIFPLYCIWSSRYLKALFMILVVIAAK